MYVSPITKYGSATTNIPVQQHPGCLPRLPRHEAVSSSSEVRVNEPHFDCRSASSSVTLSCVGSVSMTTALRLVSVATSQAFKLTQASGSPLSLQHFRWFRILRAHKPALCLSQLEQWPSQCLQLRYTAHLFLSEAHPH